MDAVWRYFDDAERALRHAPGRCTTAAAERRAASRILRALGVRRVHRAALPAQARHGRVAVGVGARVRRARRPDCVPTGRSSPSRRRAGYVRAALDAGHRRVQGARAGRRLRPARRRCSTPVWGHARRGRRCRWSCTAAADRCPGAHTGPGPFGEVLAAHPRLTAVIAHCGRAGVRRAPRRSPSATRTCTSTPRWSARRS